MSRLTEEPSLLGPSATSVSNNGEEGPSHSTNLQAEHSTLDVKARYEAIPVSEESPSHSMHLAAALGGSDKEVSEEDAGALSGEQGWHTGRSLLLQPVWRRQMFIKDTKSNIEGSSKAQASESGKRPSTLIDASSPREPTMMTDESKGATLKWKDVKERHLSELGHTASEEGSSYSLGSSLSKESPFRSVDLQADSTLDVKTRHKTILGRKARPSHSKRLAADSTLDVKGRHKAIIVRREGPSHSSHSRLAAALGGSDKEVSEEDAGALSGEQGWRTGRSLRLQPVRRRQMFIKGTESKIEGSSKAQASESGKRPSTLIDASSPREPTMMTDESKGATPAENTESSTLTGRNIVTCTVTKGGVVASNNGVELFCPPGAVDNPVSVKVTLDDQSKYYGLITQKDLENDVMFATPIFRFQPNSHAFKKPVTLTTKVNVGNRRCDDIVILHGTEAVDGSINWEDITRNSTVTVLDGVTVELKIKMEHFSLLMNLWNLTSIYVRDLVSRLNLMAFSYTMSVFLNEDSPFSISDELALLLVSKDVYYEQVYQESETSALAQLRRQGFKELHLQSIEEQEEKRIYNSETLQISVRVGEDYKLLHSQEEITKLTVHSSTLWNMGEVIKFKLERTKDVRVLCGTISVQGEYGHSSKWHFCERDLCGFVRGLLGVKAAPFNLLPVARMLETPYVLMNEIVKSWKDEDKQLKKILKHWSKEKTNMAEELAAVRKDLEALRQACRLTERGQMHVRHLRELASKISGLNSSDAALIKYFSCCIQNVCKAILRDCCIELQNSAEGVETAASTADHVRYLQNYRPKRGYIAGKYQMVCSPFAESPLNTFLLIVPNLIQDIKEIFLVRGISEVQNGLKGLPKEACEQFASTVLFAESNKSIRPLACEVCNILEMLCLKNCGGQSTSEIETWGTNLAILSMLNFLKPYFQECPQDIRLHKRLQLFSGRLREIMSDEIPVASDFFLLDSCNVTLSLIQFAKFNPSKLVRFELTDSSNSPVSCLSEDVKYDSCHDTFSQQFHVKTESEDELHLCALACVHLDGRICKKGAFESVITIKPSGEDAFDRLMIRFVDVAVIKLKVKDSEDLQVVLCSVEKDTLSDLLHVVKKDLTEELVDLRRSAVSKCHLKMRTVDGKAGMVLSLRLVYKWGSESVALDSKHFETLANSSAGGAYLPEMQIVGLKDPLTSEEAPLSLASPAGNLTLRSVDQLQKHGQIRCDKFEYHVHQTVNNMTGHNCVAGNEATLNEVIPSLRALQVGSSFSPRRSLTERNKYEELPPSDHTS